MSALGKIVGGGIVLFSMTIFGQNAGTGAAASTEGMPATDNTVKAKNAVNINPAALIWGNINASYERFLGDKHGAMLQAGLFFNNGFGIAGHYRYHYYKKDDHSGISSPFIGGFAAYENTKDDANVKNSATGSTTVYHIEATYVKVGLTWGRRWVFSNSMDITGRIGYGFPIVAKFKWPDSPPAETKSIENNKKYWNGVDAELSIGYAF
jgi:hypothetical protein